MVFGLPGNPVSSFACTRKYIYLWLNESLAINEQVTQYAVLGEDFEFNKDLHLFLPVKISFSKSGQIIAQPFSGNGSGDFANLKNADALMELNKEINEFEKGESYPILMMR